MSQIRKGRIIGMFVARKGSGIAMLALDDDLRGKTLIPCEGNPTARAFDKAFGGFIVGGHSTDNSAIQGEEIYYTLDQVGVMETFTIADRAPIEMVEEYEAEKRKRPAPRKSGHIGFVEPDDPRIQKRSKYGGRGTCTNLGILPPDDPVYTRGPIVAGREIGKPGTHTRGGFLPEDHWLYGAGPIVSGRPIFGPKRKPHEDN